MSLNQTVESIKAIKGFAVEDVDTGPRETMAGRRGRKNQAIEQLKILKRDYRRDLLQSAAFIITTGSTRSEFETLATEKFECFAANPDDFYTDLAGRIPPVLYQGKESMVNLFEIIGRHLEDKGVELDLSQYNQLIFRQEHYVSIKDKNDLVRLLKTAINSQIGAEIVGIQAVTSLVDKAIERSHTKVVTPIVLSTDDEKLALDLETSLRKLNPRGVFLVVAGKGSKTLRGVPNVISIKEPTEETVQQALKTISGATKK